MNGRMDGRPMDKTYNFYLKNRGEAIEVDGARLEDDGVKVTVSNGKDVPTAVFAWTELQGYTIEE